jgi:opacity protein-like surface antigen
MKKVMLAVAAAVLLAIPPANAADLGPRRPVYKAPPPAMVPAPAFSWTGCYIGGNIGYGWGRDTVSIPNIAETAGVPQIRSPGLPFHPLPAIPRVFSAAGRPAAIINSHRIG